MEIKYIVLDLDGTLLQSDKTISERTLNILKEKQDKGVNIILASGRPTSGIVDYAKLLELDKNEGLIVSYNGAQVQRAEDLKIIFKSDIQKDLFGSFVSESFNYNLAVMVDDKKDLFLFDDEKRCLIGNSLINKLVTDEVEDIKLNLRTTSSINDIESDILKVNIQGEPDELRRFYELVYEKYSDVLSIQYSSQTSFEVTDKTVSKGAALKLIFKEYKINPDNVLVFGDSENDQSMFVEVKNSVAMGNADKKTRELARYVTDSNDEDGIYNFLTQNNFI